MKSIASVCCVIAVSGAGAGAGESIPKGLLRLCRAKENGGLAEVRTKH